MLKLVRDEKLADRFMIDSAGTGAYHVGERADPRSREEAESRGVPLPSIARQFEEDDFDRFDYVIAMDRQNQRNLRTLARSEEDRAKVRLLRSFGPDGGELDVPDPYHGGAKGFAQVFDICDAGCRALLVHVRESRGW